MLFNKNRALDFMRRYGVDVLIASSPVNVAYFSGYFCWLDPLFKEYMGKPGGSSNLVQNGYAVFPLEGEPAIVINALFAVNVKHLWVRDFYTFDTALLDRSLGVGPLSGFEQSLFHSLSEGERNATPTDALLSLLKARGLTEARIGLELDGLTPTSKETIVRALPRAVVKDCSNLIRLIRMVKSADEISLLRRAAEINEQAGMETLALARPGLRIAELITHFRERLGDLGADFDHLAFGLAGLGIAAAPDNVLGNENAMFVDFGCIYEHYFSDTGTTLAFAELSNPLLERYAALRACAAAGAAELRPGVKVSVVRAAMWSVLSERGMTASFPHGHGLGLELRDYPIIVPDNGLRIRDDCVDVPSDLLLEAGMVVNLESPIFMPEVGSIHIEQSFVITPEGCEPLVAQDRTRPVQPSTP